MELLWFKVFYQDASTPSVIFIDSRSTTCTSIVLLFFHGFNDQEKASGKNIFHGQLAVREFLIWLKESILFSQVREKSESHIFKVCSSNAFSEKRVVFQLPLKCIPSLYSGMVRASDPCCAGYLLPSFIEYYHFGAGSHTNHEENLRTEMELKPL